MRGLFQNVGSPVDELFSVWLYQSNCVLVVSREDRSWNQKWRGILEQREIIHLQVLQQLMRINGRGMRSQTSSLMIDSGPT